MTKKSAILVGFLLLILSPCQYIRAQRGFAFPEKVTKDKLRFQLVNNLTVIPVTVNGTELSFLLDTGVSSTILFGLSQSDSLELRNANPVELIGLGEGRTVRALRSDANTVGVGKAVDTAHTLYVIIDQQLNFSIRMGVPVHGILGYDFFKQFVVKTNYISKRLTFYTPSRYGARRCKKCKDFNLLFDNNKPYLPAEVATENNSENVTLLVDSGSSDALWLFQPKGYIREFPKNYFNDFLGMGLSGDIFGKRGRVHSLALGDFSLSHVGVAFPDSAAVANIAFFDSRDGTLGAEVLRRFTGIMDYPARKMRLRPNRNVNRPFFYNMSGLVLEHQGVAVAKDVAKVNRQSLSDALNRADSQNSALGVTDVQVSPLFTFILVPKYVVAELREGSPAAFAGILQGDEVVSVNGRPAYSYKLYELVALFSSRPGREITIEIYRNGQITLRKFTLKKVL